MTRLTFLGTGTSLGVPIIGCDCGVCRSSDPRDRRLRSSALIRHDGLDILVDAGPDFRQQMLRAGVRHLDAILLTHGHKDHTGGLDDIRAFNYVERAPARIYCEALVEESLRQEYAYAFSERCHRHLSAKLEQPHADNKEKRSRDEYDYRPKIHRNKENAYCKHYQRYRQNR